MIRIRLADGITFTAHVDLETFGASFRLALKDRQTIELVNDKGQARHINPLQVLYFELVRDQPNEPGERDE